MPTHNQLWGGYGEQLAKDYLIRQNYKILASNWRCQHQEIDLVTKHHDTLVLVEVKLRLTNSFGSAREALTSQKITRLKLAASLLLRVYHPNSWRYDFIAIDLDKNKRLARLIHYQQII